MKRKIGSTGNPIPFFVTLASDHITGATGLCPLIECAGGSLISGVGSSTGSSPWTYAKIAKGVITEMIVPGAWSSAPTSCSITGSGGNGGSGATFGTPSLSGSKVVVPVTAGGSGYGPNVAFSKGGVSIDDGETFAFQWGVGASRPAGAIWEIGQGWYALDGNANDRDTLGPFIVSVESGTASLGATDPTDVLAEIVSYDPFGQGAANQDSFWANGAIVGTVNTVTSGSQFTLTSAQLSTNDNDYNGVWLCFTSGANAGISRVIGTYAGSTKQVQFTGSGVKGAFPETVSVGDAFMMMAGSN